MKFKHLLFVLPVFSCIFTSSCKDTSLDYSSNSNNISENINFVSRWGSEYSYLLYTVLGYDIPYQTSDSFELSKIEDSLGNQSIQLLLYYENSNIIDDQLLAYSTTLLNEGYSLFTEKKSLYNPNNDLTSITYNYGYKTLDEKEQSEIIYFKSLKNDLNCIAIYIKNIPYVDNTLWPSEKIKEYLGEDIPKLNGDGFIYETYKTINSENKEYLVINISNTTIEDEQNYLNILQTNDYTINSNYYDNYGYICTDKNNSYTLQFKYLTNRSLLQLIILK